MTFFKRHFLYKKYLLNEIDQLKAEIKQFKGEGGQYKLFHPPGHYYSPIPSLKEVKLREKAIWGAAPKTLPEIELNENEQLDLFEKLKQYYNELPFEDSKKYGIRYYYDNETYCYSDAIILYSMMRYLRPKKIIEAGSGFSSAVMLDTNELFFDNSVSCTFIEPYTGRLGALIKKEDLEHITIIRKSLQDVEIETFQELSENDFLIIDSTHVSKAGSDVNYIFFKILPSLKSGVCIHFHDIFYPFEYLKDWVYEGISWNEGYILRAFLQYNNAFKIIFFNTFLEHFYPEKFIKEMPLCMKNTGGSIWLKKI